MKIKADWEGAWQSAIKAKLEQAPGAILSRDRIAR
jgi:hypothetical protein